MKSGASDPFADDAAPVDGGDGRGEGEPGSPSADETNDSASSTDDDPTNGDLSTDGTDRNDAADGANDDENGDATGTASEDVASPDDRSPPEESETGPAISKADLPLLLRRDTVKAERENVHQLFVQDDTDTKARQAENELSERLDTDVYRLDAREAIYLAGMKNLPDAEEILLKWGYNF